MKHSKTKPSKAAEEIVGLFEAHFATLPPKERAKREGAFDKALVNAGSRAKSATPVAPVANRALNLHPE